jgi:hypothetical protein
MKRWLSFVRVSTALAALAVAAGALLPGAPATPAAAGACTLCGGGEYHDITPTRVFDSRHIQPGQPAGINDVAPLGAKTIGAGGAARFDIDVLGLGTSGFMHPWLPAGVATSDVLGVVASITIVSPNRAGFLSAYPVGAPSTSSVLNFSAGMTVANLAIVRPDANGRLTIAMSGAAAGSAHVVVDVFGWFSTSSYVALTAGDERGARLIATDPGRILDWQTGPAALGPGASLQLPIRGADVIGGGQADIVPDSSDIIGVMLNVTAVSPTADTYVSVLPVAPAGAPSTSNVNVLKGNVKANTVIVPIGPDGSIWLYNGQGTTRVAVDVVGYLQRKPDETRVGRVVPLSSPFRVFDTRDAAFGAVPLGPGQAEDWSFADFAGSVNIGGTSVGTQSAVIGNLTNASLARQYPTVAVASYLVTYPKQATPGAPPLVSNLNSVEAVPVPNLALVKYDANQVVTVFNKVGYAHYLLDVSAVVLADPAP